MKYKDKKSPLKTEPPTHNVIPVLLTEATTARIAQLIYDLNDGLQGLPLDFQLKASENLMRLLLKESDALGYAFGRLEQGTADAVYTEGLPVFTGDDAADLYRRMSLTLGSVLGRPFQYQQQHEGSLVPALKPVANSAPNSNSTGAHFGSHTDDAVVHKKYRVRHIALLGEHNECNAKTGFSPVEKALNLLSNRHIQQLTQPKFSFRTPASFNGLDIQNEWSEPRPILYELASGRMGVQCPTYNTRVIDNSAEEAFNAFKEAIEVTMRWFVIKEGSYLVFRNDRGLHSRKEITHGQRCVYRTYWHNDIELLRKATKTTGNVFDVNQLLDNQVAHNMGKLTA